MSLLKRNLCFCVKGSAATSLTEKIYYNLNSDGFAMCIRRFNATHQIGCSCKSLLSLVCLFVFFSLYCLWSPHVFVTECLCAFVSLILYTRTYMSFFCNIKSNQIIFIAVIICMLVCIHLCVPCQGF